MYYKKEHFCLLLKDLIKYLSLVEEKGQFFEINLLNTNHLSFNVERSFQVDNQTFQVSFHQKKSRDSFKLILHFEKNLELIMYFDKEFKDIQIFLCNNHNKTNIKKYSIFFKEEYDLSLEPLFSKYLNLFFKKNIVSDNLQSF